MSYKKKVILFIVLLSYFITAIDGSIVITGLKNIADDLHLDQSALSWVQNAYILAFGGFILLGGRLSDIYGRKNVLNVSLFLFGIGSSLAGASVNGIMMISARVLQGIGAAILAPTSLALLLDTFDGKERIKAIAWYSSISGLGSSIGLVLGGFFASFTSWRDGFYVNVPITILMLFLSYRTIESRKKGLEPLDTLGTILSISCIFSFVYAINGADNFLLWLGIAILLLVFFIIQEKNTDAPIVSFALLKNKVRVGAYITRTLYMCAMFGVWFYLSECLQQVFNYSPIVTGIAFFPMTITMFLSAVIVPRLENLYGNKITLFIGISFLMMAFIWISFLQKNGTYMKNIMIPLLLFGIGQGLSMSPLTNLGIVETNEKNAGVASGLVNVAHQIGGSVGLSIMVVFNKNVNSMLQSFKNAMFIGLVFIVLMFVVSMIFFKNYKGE